MFMKMLAHAKKQMPVFLAISAVLWGINIASSYDGRITPISWLIVIVLTAATAYVVVCGAFGILKLTWSALKRIPRGKRLPFLF